MSKNKVQFPSGYSLTDLFREYGTEEQCVSPMVSAVLNVAAIITVNSRLVSYISVMGVTTKPL